MSKLRFSREVQYILHKFKIIAPILRFFNRDFTYCEKCGLPFNWCDDKSVDTSEYEGTFATCQECWDNSTLEELKKYYTRVYEKQVVCSKNNMNHSLEHLLKCVEDEFYKTQKPKRI